MSRFDRLRTAHWEVFVQDIVGQVLKGQPVEDSRIELKSDVTDPARAARRLGGLLNAARTSDFVVWILGVDEKGSRIVPLDGFDPAVWLQMVSSRFEDVSPELLMDLTVKVNETQTVRALFFDPARAPFVVKTAPASPTKGCPEREVPWREGTMVRVAYRRDLLRILEPMSAVPSCEVMDCVVTGDTVDERFNGQIDGRLYIVPSGRDRIVLPFHRSSITLTGAEGAASSTQVQFVAPNLPAMSRHSPVPTSLVSATYSELILDGPGLVIFRSPISGRFPTRPELLQVVMRLGVANASQPLSVSYDLRFVSGSTGRDSWKLSSNQALGASPARA